MYFLSQPAVGSGSDDILNQNVRLAERFAQEHAASKCCTLTDQITAGGDASAHEF